MPGVIDKILNKIEGNGTKEGRTNSIGKSSGKSDYDTVTGNGNGAYESGIANGPNGVAEGSNLQDGVGETGMTNGTGERGIHGTGTHEHVGGRGLGKHTFGHQPGEAEAVPDRLDANQPNVHHDAFHLAHKTQETVLHPEVEEVARQRERERHIHHVQHHVQPVLASETLPEEHHARDIPVTRIHEKHVNEDAGDREAFLGLGRQHEDRLEHRAAERQIVDMGEQVNETVHHHVHNVIQPIVQKETIAPTKIHTTIPLHHVVHEAPIVHSSIAHEPLAQDQFLGQGGKLGEGLTHEKAADGLLGGDCERVVDGDGENLIQGMGIGGRTNGTAATRV